MPTQQLDYFTSLVAEDEHLPLTEAAIAVAQHAYPDLDVQGVLDKLDQLGNKLKSRITPDTSPVQRLQILKHFFIQSWALAPIRMIFMLQRIHACTTFWRIAEAYPSH